MSLSPINFTGISQFSDDFQAILERTFEIASLPLNNLRTDQTLLLAERAALGGLESVLQDLRNSFSTLGILGSQGAVTASSSSTSVATVSVVGSAEPLSFSINVTSAASTAQESSLAGLASRTSGGLTADGLYKLKVGSTETTFDLLTLGSGRTGGSTGAATPAPKVGVGVVFSNGLSGSITAELESFFVAENGPASISAGDTLSVTFAGSAGAINETIETDDLSGLESTADLVQALNDKIAANSALAGKVSFSDEGGKLKLVVSDTAGEGFTFTSESTGTIVSGLEGGGVVGGHSAKEIAAALNARVALNSSLSTAGVRFTAVDGEVKVSGGVSFNISVTDDAQGTGFASGLAGTHAVSQYGNTLGGLRDYINGKSSTLGITATIINTSSNAQAPEYRLTLTANQTGAATLTLKDSGDLNLLTTTNQGTDAVFNVNGIDVTNSSNTISDFAPGLSLTIVGAGSTTVATTNDRAGLASALANIANRYNAVVSVTSQHIGKGSGPLSGHFLLRTATSFLRQITGHNGTGDIRSIAALGLELDDKGVLSFKAATFNSLSNSQIESSLSFIGTTTTGFAGNGYRLLTDLSDPVSGQIQRAVNLLSESDASVSAQIAEEETRINRLISQVEERFSAADVLLAQLEAQQNLITRLFEEQLSTRQRRR